LNLGLRELGTSGEKIPLLSTANTWSARQTFSAGITGTLTGNADTATKLKTARKINGVAFDGSADITLTPEDLGLTDIASQAGNAVQRSGDTMGGQLKIGTINALRIFNQAFGLIFRRSEEYLHLIPTNEGEGENGNIGPLRPFSINLRTGLVSIGNGVKVGGGITGNLTGNADTATKLKTARTIGGVSFDGSANIDLPGVNKTGNQSTTGNAATATKLQTARTINGVSFDGSANISLSPANIGCPASPTGWLTTGNNGESITTAQLVTLLQNNGAFNTKAWFARCAWAYANSASIPDSETGCGIIPLAGAVIEVFSNNTNNYTIRITTATTTSVSGALTNAEFIYVSNGTSYSPGWRRAYNTKNKPTAADVGALPLSGGALTGGLTAAGEIISKSANGLRIAYGNYGFFIRNDGSST
ncbi:phage tail fiber protein, partial [Escherichia coli]|uniref:phage tail fiber protein n=1 Tax=Escherichia coli TaxID=562 RepID=UPI00359572DF